MRSVTTLVILPRFGVPTPLRPGYTARGCTRTGAEGRGKGIRYPVAKLRTDGWGVTLGRTRRVMLREAAESKESVEITADVVGSETATQRRSWCRHSVRNHFLRAIHTCFPACFLLRCKIDTLTIMAHLER